VDQPLERSAFAGFSSRLTAGLIDWPPGWIRALLRALVAVLTFAACWLPLVVAFSDAPEDPTQAGAMIAVALAFAALALIGHLWALFDPRRQSLQDRLFGLAVVKEKPQGEPTLATPVST
jgi:uncharacterized RDD family membrane protein YckC